MKSTLKVIAQALLGLVLLGGVWAAMRGLLVFARYLERLESDLAIAIIAAAATALVSIITLALSKAYETRSAIRQELRAKKTPIYESIVSTLFKVMFAQMLDEQPMSEQELKKFFAQTTDRLTIWGSDAC